jgi:hypothetical protein
MILIVIFIIISIWYCCYNISYYKPKKKIFFNNFWKEYFYPEKIFIPFISKCLDVELELGTYANSDILIESVFDSDSQRVINSKAWDKAFFFSGESSNIDYAINDEYDIILASMTNRGKIINFPEFMYYIYDNDIVNTLELRHLYPRTDIAKNEIIVFISNSNIHMAHVRNAFLDELDKRFTVVYGGKYKNNTGFNLEWDGSKTDEMMNMIKQYKIVITMENNKNEYVDTYITEKIIHGFYNHVVPIYWGTDKVTEYFNKDGMIIYDESNIEDVFNQIQHLMDNDDDWLKKVNVPVFPNSKMTRTLEDIIHDVKTLED